jgi:phenylalanyl-tRNA synthetase beta chain
MDGIARMPVIEVNLEDFSSLLGREVKIEELKDILPMMGTSWEGETQETFSLEVFPNRPDLLSIEGLVRAFSSFTGLKTGLISYQVFESDYRVIVDEKVRNVRPYFVSSVIKNIEFDDPLIRSIIQMQEKLHVTHGRKRKKVSIGLHNLKPIEFPVTYTTEKPDFKFQPLDERFPLSLNDILTILPKGKEYAWIVEDFKEYPLLLDNKDMVLSMPPIINGEYTRVDEATTELFIDITGTDLKAITEVLNIICTTFTERGAEIFNVSNNYYSGETLNTPNLEPTEMKLELDYVNSLIGLELSVEETAKLLELMGYGFKGSYAEYPQNQEKMLIQIPPYRTDIMHPIDLVEDVAIAYGYDNLKPEIPSISSSAGENPLETFCRNLRNFLVGFGFLEVVTFMMSNHEKLFTKMSLTKEAVAETANPKMKSYTVLRNRLIPSLLEVLSMNKHHSYPQNLYEVDDVILLDSKTDTGARSARRLAIVICHARANFNEVKAVMENILKNLNVKSEIDEGGWDCFIKGRRLIAKIDGIPSCWAGEIKPEAILAWDLEMPVAALEMDIDLLFESCNID